jgi:hypothetical protein
MTLVVCCRGGFSCLLISIETLTFDDSVLLLVEC